MTVAQHSSANTWFERPTFGAGSDSPVPAFWQLDGSNDWSIQTTGDEDGALIDWNNSGTYELLDATNAGVLINDGSGNPVLAASGTPYAILADDGAGNLEITRDLTRAEAGLHYQDGNGNYVIARLTAPRVTMVRVGTVTLNIHPV